MFARVALGVVLVCGISLRAAAEDFEPHTLPRATLVNALANAFGVEPGDVVDARAFDIAHDPALPGFILGRYRKAGRPWTFPALAVFAPCEGGFCAHRVYLGQAASQITPLTVVDLDAPRTAVSGLGSVWFGRMALPENPTKLARPALILAAAHQPDVEGQASRETGLIVVSLSLPTPAVLFETLLEVHEPEPSDKDVEARGVVPSKTIGVRLEGLVFTRDGAEDALTATTRPIDSRWNKCERSEATSQRYVLTAGRYVEAARVPPARPCH